MKIKNLPLMVGILLPAIFILIVSLIIFIPSLSIKPKYSFIYVANEGVYNYDLFYKNRYVVKDEHITMEKITTTKDVIYKIKGESPILYLYDMEKNTSHQITYEEAKKYLLDPGPSSPDGYSVSYRYNNNGIFDMFGLRDNIGEYIVSKGNGSKKLTGIAFNEQNYYGQDITLIGWIK